MLSDGASSRSSAVSAADRPSNPPIDYEAFHLLSDLFRLRAADPVQTPLVAFPRYASDAANFEYFDAQTLDRFISEAAWHYDSLDIPMDAELRTVALLGFTSLDWMVSSFALSRIGCTVLALSPRLSYHAIEKLMQETRCQSIVYHAASQLSSVIDTLQSREAAVTVPMISRPQFDLGRSRPDYNRVIDLAKEKKRYAAILHSSGSTGLPKPIYIPHHRFTIPYAIGDGDTDFVTLPLFHAFAFQVAPARMFLRKTVYFPNPNLPLTCSGLVEAIDAAKPDTLCVVPYVLKLLREQEAGVQALQGCKQVIFTGSECPDELGDHLVERGINIATFLASTESGYLGNSLERPPVDKAWNYVRVPPRLMDHIWAKPITHDICEFVYMKEYPTRITSNSQDPPDSFHSSDLFTPHSTIPMAWKYVGRLDDRVTLTNGEKVLPLPMEGRVRQNPLLREAVVFGIGKSAPGILLFRSEQARKMPDDDLLSNVWSDIAAANTQAESFSQISHDLTVLLPVDAEIPVTDKGSFIRPQVYKKFQREIEDAYTSDVKIADNKPRLDLGGLEKYLQGLAQRLLSMETVGPSVDLFSLGMDSLKAMQMRSAILRDVDIGHRSRMLGQNIVFEMGSIASLARYLYTFESDTSVKEEKSIGLMKGLLRDLRLELGGKRDCDVSAVSHGHQVLLTGATGALGAQVLKQLSNSSNVRMVYCLVRGNSPSSRLQDILKDMRISTHDSSRITVLECDLSQPQLGLNEAYYNRLVSCITHIIHCAWPVNFQLALPAFNSTLRGLQNLLKLSLEVSRPKPATFFFCSSISAALNGPRPATIPEGPIAHLEHAADTGYADSKLIAEKMVEQAVEEAGADAVILRIGQVVGDTEYGIWKESEAIPLIIRSALTMGSLPRINLRCEWLPSDTLAASIIQIAGLDESRPTIERAVSTEEICTISYFNLVSPHSFSWNTELLPALAETGLSFKTTSFSEWIGELQRLSATDPSEISSSAASDVKLNPALKLVDYLADMYGPDADGGGSGRISFEIANARAAASAFRNAPAVIESGLLRKMVARWMEKWDRY